MDELKINPPNFKLMDIYFDTISFKQTKEKIKPNIKLNVSYKYDFQKNDELKTMKVIISLFASSDDIKISLELKTIGLFSIDFLELNEECAQQMVNYLYPYLRHEVQIITTQPGLIPIILPLKYPIVHLNENIIVA